MEPTNAAAPIELTGADAGRPIAAQSGQRILVTLQTIGGGSYGEPTVSSPSVRYAGQAPAAQQNPGGPRQVYQFEAVSAGAATVEVPHTGPQGSFSIEITVK